LLDDKVVERIERSAKLVHLFAACAAQAVEENLGRVRWGR
jgi:hypothetical protein